MRNLFNWLWLAIIVAASALGIFIAGLVVYLWFYGIVIGLEHVMSMPIGAGILLVVVLVFLLQAPAIIILGLFGIWSGITVIGWPWYGAVALYFPVVAFYTAIMLVVPTVGLFAALASTAMERFKALWNKRR